MRYGHNKETKEDLRKGFSYVKSQIMQRWAKANKQQDVFLKINQSWLEGTFEIRDFGGLPCEEAHSMGILNVPSDHDWFIFRKTSCCLFALAHRSIICDFT